jgi:hypothetical protein
LVIDKSSFAKADKELAALESRIRGLGTTGGRGFSLGRFSLKQDKLEAAILKGLEIASVKLTFNVSKFDVNQTALNIALGTALDIASTRNTFQIARFHVDQSHLNAALITAMAAAAKVASQSTTLRPKVNPTHIPGSTANDGGIRPRHAAVAGGIAGGMSRLYAPALALGLGGYGLSELNQRNQQVVSAQLQSQAVIQQAGGTAEQGQGSFQYLRKEGERIGFNYLDASGDYNKLISGLTGSGVSVKDSQKVFSGFAELARVNKLDKTTQNRLFRALSQVAGKGKLQSEELTGQIAEALPGGTALFAQAYQSQLKATGKGKGDLTGQAAIQALLADMKKGKVTSDILTYAGATASERANEGGALGKASLASQAEQARYQNAVSDLAVVASNAGVEEGFARIFRTLNAGLSESNGLVTTLAEGFNEATKWADDLLLFPQSFVRALEGKDSLVADWLGEGKTKELVADWQNIKQIFSDISSLKFDFLPTLEATSKEIAAILNAIAGFEKWKNGQFPSVQEKGTRSDTEKANLFGLEYTSPAAVVGDLSTNFLVGLGAAKTRGQAIYDDPTSPYYQNPTRFDADRELSTQYYQNFKAMQADPEGDKFAAAVRAAIDSDALGTRLNSSLTPTDTLTPTYESQGFGLNNQNAMESSLGLFNNPETTPSGQPYQDLSQYNPQSPVEIEDYNKSLAMSQAEAAVTNNNVTNNFDIAVNVDATLAGIEVEAQAQAMANATATALTGAFEQAQVNWPSRE